MTNHPNDTPRYGLPHGVRTLLEQITATLDLPAGDPRIGGATATVTGVLRAALKDNATDHDCLILASIVQDSMTVTAPAPTGGLPHRVPQDSPPPAASRAEGRRGDQAGSSGEAAKRVL